MQSELLQQIEQAAIKNLPPPKNMKAAEVMLYHALCGLYAQYHTGQITKEQGHKQKITIFNAYEEMLKERERYIESAKEFQRKIREGYTVSGVTILEGEKNAS